MTLPTTPHTTLRLSTTCLALALAVIGSGCSRNELASESASAPVVATLDSHEMHDVKHQVHDEHAAHSAAPTLEPGHLWATDEPLRMAMQRIRVAVDRAASTQEQKPLNAVEAQALAVVVEKNITDMITNCKLAPKPDAALHVLIGRMLSAASVLKKDPASNASVQVLHTVLHDYQSTFDHPGWSPLNVHDGSLLAVPKK